MSFINLPAVKIIQDVLLKRIAFVGVYLLLISICIFFHFTLDHEIKVIHDWLTEKQWSLINGALAIKVALSIFFFKFKIHDFLKVSSHGLRELGPSFFVCLLTILLAVVLANTETLRESINLKDQNRFNPMPIQVFLFYFLDFLMMRMFLLSRRSIDKNLLWYSFVDFAVMIAIYKGVISQFADVNFDFAIFYIMLLVIWFIEKFNFYAVVAYIAIVVLPISYLFGWGDLFSEANLFQNLRQLLLVLVAHLLPYIWLFKSRDNFTEKDFMYGK